MQPTTTAGATPQTAATRDLSLEQTLQLFTDTFNRFDAKAVASFWAEDGTLLNPVGNQGRGRAGVERVYREDAETILAGSTSKFTLASARMIGDDCAFLDVEHDIQNFRSPDGSVQHRALHLVVLAKRENGRWSWLDARPYAFMPRPPQVH